VPDPNGKVDSAWFTVDTLAANVGPDSRFTPRRDVPPVAGVTSAQAEDILTKYVTFAKAWLDRDVDGVNRGIRALNEALPKLERAGMYPSLETRRLEVRYHRLDLTKKAWIFYIVAFFLAIFALGTGFRWVRVVVMLLLTAAIGLHGWALGMRWEAIGRIPVANMYEAVVSSTFVGALLGFLLELGGGIAAGFGRLFGRGGGDMSAIEGMVPALEGKVRGSIFPKGVFALAAAFLGFFALSLPELNIINSRIDTMMPILDDIMLRIHTVLIISSYAVITLAFAVANCYLCVAAHRDGNQLAQGILGAQFGLGAVLLVAYFGVLDQYSAPVVVGLLTAAPLGGAMLGVGVWSVLRRRSPMSIDAPSGALALRDPEDDILQRFHLSHRVLLYIAAIALFVGLVLGAVWADYSWGRPWGWDPKEVFALNTWLVYAILIHVPFVTKRRALWTSVLSVMGFAVMQFNWWVVNFYIVGLHSYA